MKVEILGSGGAITIPVPFCHCTICTEARGKGIPYARSGPSTFVHGPDVLIDTPEEIKDQLNRSQVTQIAACVYSHWHPDHTMGRRVWETSYDWRHYPPQSSCTDLYVPERVAQDFEAYYNVWGHLRYFERGDWSASAGRQTESPFQLAARRSRQSHLPTITSTPSSLRTRTDGSSSPLMSW